MDLSEFSKDLLEGFRDFIYGSFSGISEISQGLLGNLSGVSPFLNIGCWICFPPRSNARFSTVSDPVQLALPTGRLKMQRQRVKIRGQQGTVIL